MGRSLNGMDVMGLSACRMCFNGWFLFFVSQQLRFDSKQSNLRVQAPSLTVHAVSGWHAVPPCRSCSTSMDRLLHM